MKSAPFVVFLKVAAVFDLGIGSGDFSGMVPSREREMGMRSTVLRPMTALGQTRKSAPASATFDLPPTSDITRQSGHFRKVPIAEIGPARSPRKPWPRRTNWTGTTSEAGAILVNAPTLGKWYLLQGPAVAISRTTGIYALVISGLSRREDERFEIGVTRIECCRTK